MDGRRDGRTVGRGRPGDRSEQFSTPLPFVSCTVTRVGRRSPLTNIVFFEGIPLGDRNAIG